MLLRAIIPRTPRRDGREHRPLCLARLFSTHPAPALPNSNITLTVLLFTEKYLHYLFLLLTKVHL
jgi:hypothetical protein